MTDQALETGKEPWLAVILSAVVFPGIGQIYAGHLIRGVVLAGLIAVLFGLGLWLFLSLTGSVWIGFQLMLTSSILYAFSIFDAYRCTRKANNAGFEALRKQEKDPWFAVLLSRILPGLGHFYLGKWLWAVLLVFLALLIAGISASVPLAYGVFLGLLYGSAFHAYISSPTRRAKSRRLILGVCVILLVRQLFDFALEGSIPGVGNLTSPVSLTSIRQSYSIQSMSMAPALQVGDRLMVDKAIYRTEFPQRGDIIAFEASPDLGSEETSIKRVVGLPGETLEIKAGQVYIDGQPLEETYVAESAQDDYGPAKVPANSYFLLGDDRNNSFDSRAFGAIPHDSIIGQATKIFWPLRRSGVVQ